MGGWRQQGDNERGQTGRALRNRRYKRIFQENHQTKRLFTPEIKRFLKGWLVRRRKNPYPNRTEKKELAFKTGLTYIQICNWFANWRRKLKNSSHNSEDSWGHLIKDYNNKAKGNVEQFSISSDDSIWDETAYSIDSERNSTTVHEQLTDTDHCYYSANNNNETPGSYGRRCRRGEEDSSGDEEERGDSAREEAEEAAAAEAEAAAVCGGEEPGKPVLLSKWLESAARYTAKDSYVPWAAYNVTWESPERRARPPRKGGRRAGEQRALLQRHREELDAAEALTYLSVWPIDNVHKTWCPISGH